MKTLSTRIAPSRTWVAAAALAVLIAGAWPASAQLSSTAVVHLITRHQVGTPALKGTDSAYDPANQVFLNVASCYGASCPGLYGPVYGIFVDRNGTPVTGIFSIKPGGGGEGHFPRVRYSPHVNGSQGGFLVTWIEEGAAGANLVLARVVAFPGVAIGAVHQLNGAGSFGWLESGAAIGYSPTSQRFLVAWRTYPPDGHVAARLVDVNGAGLEGVVRLSAGFGRDPGVAWHSASNVFGVSFGGENAAGSAGFSGFAIVPPVNAAAFSRQSFNQISGFTYISDVDFNPDTGRFVMAWYQAVSGVGPEVRVAEIDGSANVLTSGLVSRDFAGYDAVSVAFNPISRTFLLGGIPQSDEVMVAELNRNGVRTSGLANVAPGVIARYPRVASSTNTASWNAVFNDGFQVAKTVGVATTSRSGGPSGTHPPDGTTSPAPGPTPGPAAPCPTVQPGPGWTCSNGNWLPPSDAPAPAPPTPAPSPVPPSTGCTSVRPGPDWTCSNGDWLPPGAGAPPVSSPPPAPAPPTAGCTSPRPGPDWGCSNGGWLPPGMFTPAPAPAPAPSPSSCTTTQPGAGWVCVAGNWLPPGAGGASCPTVQPGSGWVCVGGNWLPPGAGGASCPTVQPGSGWVCVGGNWLPPGTGGGSGSGCTSVQPGSNWTCVNGGWIPPDFSCTTVRPGANWTCVNGNWLPPGLPEPEAEYALSGAGVETPRARVLPSALRPEMPELRRRT